MADQGAEAAWCGAGRDCGRPGVLEVGDGVVGGQEEQTRHYTAPVVVITNIAMTRATAVQKRIRRSVHSMMPGVDI